MAIKLTKMGEDNCTYWKDQHGVEHQRVARKGLRTLWFKPSPTGGWTMLALDIADNYESAYQDWLAENEPESLKKFIIRRLNEILSGGYDEQTFHNEISDFIAEIDPDSK